MIHPNIDKAIENLDQLLAARRKANWHPRVASELYRVDITLAREKALVDAARLPDQARADALREMGALAIEQGLALWIEEARARGHRVTMMDLHDRAIAFAARAAIDHGRVA